MQLSRLWLRVVGIAFLSAGFVILAYPMITNVYGWWGQRMLATSFERAAQVPDLRVHALTGGGQLISNEGYGVIVPRTGATEAAAEEEPEEKTVREVADDPTFEGRGPIAVTDQPIGPTRILIPKIGLDQVVVEGIEAPDLAKGPGHYPGTALPGMRGNVVISGHRVTFTHPFKWVDRLRAGDRIVLRQRDRNHVYKVTKSWVVRPTEVSVLFASDEAILTLTTCHPRYSARYRLIVRAELVQEGGLAR